MHDYDDTSPRTSRHTAQLRKGSKLSPPMGFTPDDLDRLSPAQRHGLPRSPSSTASEESDDGSDIGQPLNPVQFPGQRKESRTPSTVAVALTRDLERGAPGDPNQGPQDMEKMGKARQRSKYYESAFGTRGNPGEALAERINKDSVIIADIKTNVIINDEYTFITGLSSTLSLRYQRPESCVFVQLQHSACILFAGSFEPTYSLTITGLPQNVQPTSNKRNAMMLQTWLGENLEVEPSRGIIRFIGAANSELAIGGRTFLAQEEEEAARKASMRKGSRTQSIAAGMPLPPPPPVPPKTSAGRIENTTPRKRKSFLRMFQKAKTEEM